MEERPHEKPRTEVQEFVDDVKSLWDRVGNTILMILVVGSLTVLVINFVRYRSQTAHDLAWTDVANSTAPESFAQIAQDYRDPAVKQFAWLSAADLKLRESLTAGKDAASGLLDEAEALYRKVEASAEHPIYKANALEGLAVVAEGRRDEAEAAKRYDALIALGSETPGLASWAARAEARKARLSAVVTPVEFAESPEPPGATGADALAPAGEALGVEAPTIDTAAEADENADGAVEPATDAADTPAE